MKEKTITITVLTANEGKVLINGETYANTVYVPENADVNEWREVTLSVSEDGAVKVEEAVVEEKKPNIFQRFFGLKKTE